MWQWIIDNQEALIAAVFAAHALALIIVNLTPTPHDNTVLAKIYKWIEKLAGVVSKKVKD